MNKLLIKRLPLLLFVALAIFSCKENNNKKDAEVVVEPIKREAETEGKSITFTPDQYNLSDVQIGTVESRNLSSVIKMTGVIDAEPGNVASVSAPLGGYVTTPGMLPGEYVKKGQLLATLENPDFISIQQEYLESVGKLEYLEQEFKRQQILREEDVNAAKTFQQVSSDVKVLRAKMAGLEQRLALIGLNATELKRSNTISRTANIYAPISGYIKASNINRGKYVAPIDVLFEIMGTNDLHLALNAFEKDLGKIRKGQTVKFSLSSENKYDRMAKVYLVGQAADENKLIPVHCHLSSGQGLLPGMYIKALLETGAALQNVVPSEAIVQTEGVDYIIIQINQSKDGYTFQLVPVSKGIEQAGYTAIELPSTVNSRQLKVVVKNAYTILSAIKNAEEEE